MCVTYLGYDLNIFSITNTPSKAVWTTVVQCLVCAMCGYSKSTSEYIHNFIDGVHCDQANSSQSASSSIDRENMLLTIHQSYMLEVFACVIFTIDIEYIAYILCKTISVSII